MSIESNPAPLFRVGVDVGGTFTDVFVLDDTTGSVQVAKVPTSRPDQAVGFLAGIRQRVDDLSALAVVVHGTTAGTNALLERKGATTGIITTAGLRDVLEMRRRDRPRTWGLRGDYIPVVDRQNRLEVPERTLADGTIRTPVDLDAVREAAEQLLAAGCESVAVLFAHAYANNHNENLAVQAVREIWPNPHVSASSQILPEIREFERFSTTSLNAYLQPEVSGYLQRLDEALAQAGFTGEFMVVQSNGGLMSIDTACRLPVRTALSGPAAGVIAAGYVARTAGFNDVITCDLGGTSFDVALITDGQSMLGAQASIDFGLVIRTPMIEMTTIGAGGGSIAWVDAGGLLQVGPESAGSDPGPVAYGLGNTRPTVTDANVVLSRIDASRPMGGSMSSLDVAAAQEAIDSHVARPLKLDTHTAAEAILRVANSRMAGAIRLVSIERGFDPQRFTFMPFGGGGALHAGALLREVGLARALVPRYPGVTSAMGCVIADMRQDYVQTLNTSLDILDETAVNALMQRHVSDGLAVLSDARTHFASHEVLFEFDMAYVGQTHTVAVPIPATLNQGRVGSVSREHIATAFDTAYRSRFSRLLEGGTRRVINLRSAIKGIRLKFDLRTLAPCDWQTAEDSPHPKTTRQVHIGGHWCDTAIHDRLSLPIGAVVHGPAILEQADATVLIEPGLQGRVDEFGNTVIEADSSSTGKAS